MLKSVFGFIKSESNIKPEQNQPKENIDTIEEQAITLYSYVKELALMKYESELRREDSLIQQSSHMQTAFSFTTTAVFMAMPILIANRGNVSLDFFFWSVSSIVFFLLMSLVFASLAQRRVQKESLLNISDIEKFVSEHHEEMLPISAQQKQWVSLVDRVQRSIEHANKTRVELIQWSMRSYFTSIGLIAYWYIIGIFIVY